MRHAFLLLVLGAGAAVGPRVLAEPGASPFSHQDWSTVLQQFVNEEGLVDYVGLDRDRSIFDRYIRSIQATSPQSLPEQFAGRQEALAYYLNAYNAQVFKGVLARGPEDRSVWRGLISGYGFFVRMSIKVGGARMSLKSLEDKVIRAQFQDPRVHAALNCASLGCPRLSRVAFEPARLDEQLDAAMREFVTSPRHCKRDDARHVVTLSRIFDWFSEDFLAYERAQGNGEPVLIDYLNRYRSPDAQIPRTYTVRFLSYDKGINQQ